MGRLRSLAPLSPPPRGAVGERNAARFFAASVAPSRGVWGTKLYFQILLFQCLQS